MKRFFFGAALAMGVVAACAPADPGEGEGEGAEGEGEGEGEGVDVPPTETAALQSWIAGGTYLGWECEQDAHAPRAPSPHPRNRICSNPLLSAANGTLPIGSASVKEIFSDEDDVVDAWAVTVKTAAGGAADPGSYYYYEGGTSGTPAAAGAGNSGGVAQTVCYDCHSHGPEAGGTEQFFTIVR